MNLLDQAQKLQEHHNNAGVFTYLQYLVGCISYLQTCYKMQCMLLEGSIMLSGLEENRQRVSWESVLIADLSRHSEQSRISHRLSSLLSNFYRMTTQCSGAKYSETRLFIYTLIYDIK